MRWPAVPLALLWPCFASAVTAPERTLADRAAAADRVVLARTVSSDVVVQGGDPARMKTVTRVEVLADYKGQGRARIDVVQLGGRWGAWERRVPGDAVFRPGERALLFLRCRTQDRCALVGLGRGKLEVLDGAGGTTTVRVPSPGGAAERPLAELLRALGVTRSTPSQETR